MQKVLRIRACRMEAGLYSKNDTLEIQERMLAMAERLERGEDIPELGICHNGAKDESVDMDG